MTRKAKTIYLLTMQMAHYQKAMARIYAELAKKNGETNPHYAMLCDSNYAQCLEKSKLEINHAKKIRKGEIMNGY